MEFWNQLINNAMKGTGNKVPAVNDLPESIAEAGSIVLQSDGIDPEEKFLQLAAIAMNYRQCGVAAANKEQATITVCPPEEKKYCNAAALQALKDILTSENIPLLRLWLQLCAQLQQIVAPQMVPVLLAKAEERKGLWNLAIECCGKRGIWLAGLNDAWSSAIMDPLDDPWETGTLDQRTSYLKQLRKDDVKLALENLEKVWPVEDAATKLSLLTAISDSIGEADISFLESLSVEKSKKVKEAVNQLLKRIPTSAVVLRYTDLLKNTVSIKKEKGLLGIGSKTILQFQLPVAIDSTIFTSGIEKLSSSKDFTDDEFIIYQLVQSVPPSFWQQYLQAKESDIIGFFQKSEMGKKMLPALVLAIINFRDAALALVMMEYSDICFIDLLPLLPPLQHLTYSIKFFDKYPEQIIGYALEQSNEWNLELAQKIVRFTAANPYKYTRAFYNEHIDRIPVKITSQLQSFTPKELQMQNSWNTLNEHVLKLLQLKSQTIQSLN